MRTIRHAVVAAVFLLVAVNAGPAWALVDFSGEWAPRFWEDQPERVPGPELGNYLGVPINEAARMRGDTWDAAMQTLPEWSVLRETCRIELDRCSRPIGRIVWHIEARNNRGLVSANRRAIVQGRRLSAPRDNR